MQNSNLDAKLKQIKKSKSVFGSRIATLSENELLSLVLFRTSVEAWKLRGLLLPIFGLLKVYIKEPGLVFGHVK